MAQTAAQYKAAFELCLAYANNNTTYKPEIGQAFSHLAGVWAFLWAEKSMMDKNHLTPSAAANAYATNAENELNAGWGWAANWPQKPTVALTYANKASNWAYAFASKVKQEAP